MHDILTDDLSPRERRHQRTHQAILDAARAIIHEQGADALSMRAIADRIDYSPAGLYEYFGGKDEIIAAVCTQGHRRLKSYLAAVDDRLPVQTYLVELGLAYIRFALNNPDYFLLIFTTTPQAPAGSDPKAELLSEDSSFPILLQAVSRGINEGAVRSRPGFAELEVAYALWGLVHGIAMLRTSHLQHQHADFDVVDRQALASLVRGLGS
jgi:AcrR family transcriptional regulator